MPDIIHKVFIGCQLENVLTALTQTQALAAWWTPSVNTISAAPVVIRFPFGNTYFKDMRVEESSSDEMIRWSCIAGADEWIGTNIEFKLRPGTKSDLTKDLPELRDQLNQSSGSTGVVVGFRHSDWRSQSAMFEECNYTWALFLRSLKAYCETGKGTPWPNQHRVSH